MVSSSQSVRFITRAARVESYLSRQVASHHEGIDWRDVKDDGRASNPLRPEVSTLSCCSHPSQVVLTAIAARRESMVMSIHRFNRNA